MRFALLFYLVWIFNVLSALNLNLYFRDSGRKHTKRHSIVQRLQETDESLLVGQISIGHPKQTFTVGVDISTDLTWVPKYGCDLSHATTYFTLLSGAFTDTGVPFTLQNSLTQVKGTIATDLLSLDGKPIGLVEFGLACTAPDPYDEDDEISGMLGLAKTVVTPGLRTTVLGVIRASGLTDSSIFTLYYTCHKDCMPGEPAAQLTIGEINPLLYNEPIDYLALLPSAKWQVTAHRMSIGSKILINGSFVIELATQVSFILGPLHEVRKINTLLGFHFFEKGIFTTPCNQITLEENLEIIFGRFILPTAPAYYIARYRKEGVRYCTSPFAFVPDSDQAHWTVGTVIWQDIFTVFDRFGGRVGFADRRCLKE